MAWVTASLVGSSVQVFQIGFEGLRATFLAMRISSSDHTGFGRAIKYAYGSFSFLYSVSEPTNHKEEPACGNLWNDSAIGFLHTCPSLLKLICQRPVFIHLNDRVSWLYNLCAFDLLRRWREKNIHQANHEQNPKDIPKQEELSSVFQRCEALVDTQIESLGH